MVFKAKGAFTFKLKVAIPTRNGGKARTFSTGSTIKAVALDVERMVQRMKGRREWAALEAVFDDLVSLAEVYDADSTGRLDALLAELRDVDLEPLVTEWAKRANAKYVRQVRAFIPESKRFPVSRFRRKVISEFLAGLNCSDPTRNRYRAALSVFARWLVEREVLDTNPVRDVAMYKERDPRMVWMTWKDAGRVVDAASEPLSWLFAMLAGTGMELSAALALTVADVTCERVAGKRDAYTLHARGSKTPWRNRVVRVHDAFQHHVVRAMRGKVGNAPLFPPMRHAVILAAFRDALAAAKLPDQRLHDLRHTYAVNALKQGYKPQVVAHQLGHKDASMVNKCYGRFVPDESDYVVDRKRGAK